MKFITGPLALILILLPTVLMADSWTGVPMIDTLCSRKFENPDEHTVACALQCAKGGYGILDAEGKFLRFDENGDRLAIEALKVAKGRDHIRVTVEGEVREGILHVVSLSLTTGGGE